MPLSATVLFDYPQQELASRLRAELGRCARARIVTGFATDSGIDLLVDPQVAAKLDDVIVGAGTYSGFLALDKLLAAGVRPDRLRVHLGHTRRSGTNKHPFVRFHPMLHSKIYYLEYPGGTAAAFVGSHNLTRFALAGENGEASVLLTGSTTEPELAKVRAHIDEAAAQAIVYDSSMKEQLTWWTREFIEGLRVEVGSAPKDYVTTPTIIVLAQHPAGAHPAEKQALYLELPEALFPFSNVRVDCHVYLFDVLPASPSAALASLSQARRRIECSGVGLEEDGGATGVKADWHVLRGPPVDIRRTRAGEIQTATPANEKQIRVKVKGELTKDYDYDFSDERAVWTPQLGKPLAVRRDSDAPGADQRRGKAPFETQEWFLVTGLTGRLIGRDAAFEEALRETSPESGSYVLFATRRRTVRR